MTQGYDRTVGYSPLECADLTKLRQVIRINKTILDSFYSPEKADTVLVAGAGTGQEAVLVSREFQLKTIGVDLNIDRSSISIGSPDLDFQKQDLLSLAFRENTFSLVYCYHVLEHVSNHRAVLDEICRVLKPRGVLFIGFPNKHRLASYMGTSQKATPYEKIKWNLIDYGYRLSGRFENAAGAHAGFTEREFIRVSSELFTAVWPVRNRYMLLKYPRYALLIRIFIATGLEEFLFPSNYYVCIKSSH
jgi:ubiquinone/menaquinone biosynthesis C-methylase UbiE